MINKLIIPAAGIGSRFLPITKSIPKEMLPLSNKPAIQYIVEEGLSANINNMLIILSAQKSVIIDYFSSDNQLDQILAEQGKQHYVEPLNAIIKACRFQYFIQNKPLGLAHALLHAQPAIQPNEYFAVALPDDIIIGAQSDLCAMIDIAQKHKAMVIAVMQVPDDKINAYGVVAYKQKIADGIFEIDYLIEKPTKEQAPSNMAIVGRYIFHHDLFTYIPQTKPATNNEILLPDTINDMIKAGYKVFAYVLQSDRFDTGTPAGWLEFVKQHNNL